MRLLLIENHKPQSRALKRGLEERGFEVDVVHNGQADAKARAGDHDVIVFNMAALKGDGLALMQEWRVAGIKAIVVALTPTGPVKDEVRCLEMGADDFLTTPFEPEELFARLRALIRRRRPVYRLVLRIGDLEIDTNARVVKRAGQLIHLTPREFALLEFLARHRGRVVSRWMIWNELYHGETSRRSNIIDVYIRYLRGKIDTGPEPLIETRWGEGYLLRAESA